MAAIVNPVTAPSPQKTNYVFTGRSCLAIKVDPKQLPVLLVTSRGPYGGNMKTCIYTRQSFECSDGEHVLQNFLGARWVSRDIACNEIQSQFGSTIDLSLERGLRQFRNLLGSRGGRGGDGPDIKNVTDKSGNKYHMRPGGVPFLAEPIIQTQELDDGSQLIRATLGDFSQLGWAVAKMQTQFPNARLDIGEIQNNLKSSNDYLTDPLKLSAGIGCGDYFRGLLKAAFNLLGANNSEVALLPCFDAIRSHIVNGKGRDADHVRWMATADSLPFPELGPFDHFIAVSSRGETVEGIVQFFGSIRHLIRLTDRYSGPDISFAYRVNPLRDSNPSETRQPEYDIGQVPAFDGGHESPNDDVWGVYSALFVEFMQKHHQRAKNREIERIVCETLAPYDGKLLPSEAKHELLEKMSVFIASRLSIE